MRKALVALTVIFILGHLAWIPATFDDIDAINFGLGVRSFDVAAHQPHPPGYPVFIAAAKLTTAAVRAIGIPAPEVRGLVILGILAAAVAIPLLFLLFDAIAGDEQVAAWAVALTLFSPVFWLTTSRPLSDVTGLAVTIAAQACLAVIVLERIHAAKRPWLLTAAAALSALAIGVRSQSFTLTLPLLVTALIKPDSSIGVRSRMLAIVAFGAGIAAWALPLILLTGGVDAYLAALGDQAGEDFVGATMLWTTHTPRAIVAALQYTVLWPWGSLLLGAIVTAVAAAGFARLALRRPRGIGVWLLAYGPYAVFHLLFQETVMIRYALPLVPAMALLASVGLAMGGRAALASGSVAYVAAALVMVIPANRAIAAAPSPGAAAVIDAAAAEGAGALGMHAVMRRHEQWYFDSPAIEVLRARHGGEILSVVDYWKRVPHTTVQFLADPRRTDLAMLDSRSRELVRRYEWPFPEMPLMGGARPNAVERYRLRPPGWMLDQGWALTAEIAGQSFRAGARPEVRPSIAWIRSRQTSATMVIGGRNLGSSGAPRATLRAALPSGWSQSWEVDPGFFVRRIELPAGILNSAEPYLPLAFTSITPEGAGVRISLEQFDLQDAGVPMLAFGDGWQEPEYNPAAGLAWRWMASQSDLWVRPVGRDVTLTLRAESPLKYFDRPPHLRLSLGEQVLSDLTPNRDFTWTVTLPGAALASSGGRVAIASDQWFVPGGNGDQRQLALRVYAVHVD